MNQIVLFEDEGFRDLLPLTFWRSVFELQVGRTILLDRTAQKLGLSVGGIWTRDWIARVAEQRCGAPVNRPIKPGAILVNGRWLPDAAVEFPEAPCVGIIKDKVTFVVCDAKLADVLSPNVLLNPDQRRSLLGKVRTVQTVGSFVRFPWDIVTELGHHLCAEWKPADARMEGEVDTRAHLEKKERIHLGERARVLPFAILDASKGPIYISHDVVIASHAVVEGPAYLGPGSRVNPHSWLHGGNAIGPACKVGGEINSCVIHGYSNKQHHGYLGHSLIGSWVNVGAGATNSDLKNTYGTVRVPINGTDVETNQMFFGAVIGDFAKIGINAAIPTGASIGFASAIAATRLAPKFLPSLHWFTEDGTTQADPARLLDAAKRMMARRGIELTHDEIELFLKLNSLTRDFDKQGSPLPH